MTNFLRHSPRRRILVLGLALIGVGLLLNPTLLVALFSPDGELSQRSVVIIWLFDIAFIAAGLVLALSRSFVTLLNVFVGLVFTALLLYGAEKIIFHRLNNPTPPPANAEAAPPPIHFEGSYTDNFFQDDALLGYKPRPETQFTSIKKAGDTVIYDVTYTIDAYGRRMTPTTGSEQPDKFILFFGDSFTFGEGVAEAETLPAHVAALAPPYAVYNYGLSGYGPQQMLAKLQSDELDREVPQRAGIAVYVFIDAHVERAIGSMYVYNAWGDDMPYYTLDRANNLVRYGSFRSGRPLTSALYEVLGQTEFAKYYHLNIPAPLRDRHYALAVRIIAAARDTFQAKYNSDQFYVVIYPDEGDYFEDMQYHLEAAGLKILNYDERLKLDTAQGLAIEHDGHPTGNAHQIVAGWLVEDLNIGAGQSQ